MPSTKEILQDASSLPVEERLKVVDSLLHSLNPPDPDMDQLWATTARKRLEELRCGKVQAIPADDVLMNIRKRFTA